MADSTRPDPAAIFARPGHRHDQRIHTAGVVEIERRSPSMLRIVLAGADLADLSSTGPADHVRVFFPVGGPGPGRGPATDVHRDFTPLPVPGDGPRLALDFALHPNPGPASRWAAAATVGSSLSLAGPRGSRAVPPGADELLLIGDESALPSISRWVAESAAHVQVRVLVVLRDRDDDAYLAAFGSDPRVLEHQISDQDDLLAAVRGLGPIGPRTFVFAAGEAGAIRPVRHHLRRVLDLPAEQVSVSGYWRRDDAGYDHHLPLDPDDPDPRPGRPRGARP